jgi:hypothetical protein
MPAQRLSMWPLDGSLSRTKYRRCGITSLNHSEASVRGFLFALLLPEFRLASFLDCGRVLVPSPLRIR